MSKIGLQPTQSLTEAGQKIFAYHFHDLLKHEIRTQSDKDIEAVHDMRVATRRLRATTELFNRKFSPNTLEFLKRDLKDLTHVLGSIRDLEVFIENLTAYQQPLSFDEQTELTPLVEYCYLKHDEARIKMQAYLDSKAYEKFKSKTTKFIKKEIQISKLHSVKPIPYQIRHIAPLLIYNRYETIRAYEPFLTDAPIELLHQLRIAFKHFRYMLENFQELLGNESAIVLSETKKIQNHLGDLNDANVACQFLENFLRHSKHNKSMAITRYLNAKIAEKEQLLLTFPQAWHHFNSRQMRQHLALAIAVL